MSRGISSSICYECFDRFFINSDEVLVPSNMTRLSKNNTNPVNWADWDNIIPPTAQNVD